jgi:hypothetical protein
VVAAKDWLSDNPFDPSAGWLLRECLRLRSGKQFAKLALNWIGTQNDTAQVADVLASLVTAEPNPDVLMETRAWLARNWYGDNPTTEVIVTLCKSRSEEAFQLGFSYVERIYTCEKEFFNHQDAMVGVLVWLFSKGARVDAGDLLVRLLSDAIQREEWTTVIDAAFRKVKAPTSVAIEFAKRWLRAGRFESGDWVIVSMLLNLKPDQETIEIAREFLANGLRIGIAEDLIRKRLKRLGAY